MADALPAPEPEQPKDVLQLAATEHATRMVWVHKRIADCGYQPLPPPAVWCGRDMVIQGAMEVFGLTDQADAARLVDLACDELFSKAGTRKDVAKRLVLMRIADIRQIVRKAIRDGRKEMTYKFEEGKEPGTVRKVPVKEKIYEGTDMAAVGRLLAVEEFECRVLDLFADEGSGVDDVAALFEELEKNVAAKRGSMAQRARDMPIEQLHEAGQLQVIAAVRQLTQGAKQVKSKVLPEPKEPMEGDDDEHGSGEPADGD